MQRLRKKESAKPKSSWKLRRELGDPERCSTETPELREMRPGHRVACHFAEQLMGERRSSLVGAGAEHSDARQLDDVDETAPTDVGPAADEDTFFPGDVTQR